MRFKKAIIYLTAFFLIGFSLLKFSLLSHAQLPTQGSSDNIPSDLSLDLKLAQQNPAPDQQTILNAETKQASIISQAGNSLRVIPQDKVDPKVQTENKDQSDHPEQTTSEQVIAQPVVIQATETPEPNSNEATQIPVSQPPSESVTGPQQTTGEQITGNMAISPTGSNLVPGTDVVEPDDNAVEVSPTENPNPTGQPETTVAPSNTTQPTGIPANPNDNSGQVSPTNGSDNGNFNPPTNPTGSDNQQVTPNQSIPLENSPAPDNSNQQQPTSPPENNNPPPQDNNNPPPTDNSGGSNNSDTNSVQGVSTVNQLGLLKLVLEFLFGKK